MKYSVSSRGSCLAFAARIPCGNALWRLPSTGNNIMDGETAQDQCAALVTTNMLRWNWRRASAAPPLRCRRKSNDRSDRRGGATGALLVSSTDDRSFDTITFICCRSKVRADRCVIIRRSVCNHFVGHVNFINLFLFFTNIIVHLLIIIIITIIIVIIVRFISDKQIYSDRNTDETTGTIKWAQWVRSPF